MALHTGSSLRGQFQLRHWIENSGKPIWVEHNAKPAGAGEFCLVGFYLQESESEEAQINIR